MAGKKAPADMLEQFADAFAMKGFLENSDGFSRRLAQIALDAAGQSSKLSADWNQEMISELRSMSELKARDKQSTERAQEFARKQMESTAKNMEAFGEVARNVQNATLALMMEYGRTMQEQAEKAGRNTVKAAREASKTDK